MKVRFLIIFLSLPAFPLRAQDLDWVRDWESAQRERPVQLSSHSRIAPESEAGDPLIVHGRVFHPDGVTPAAGVVVFAYHTDANGLYRKPGEAGWRLKGWTVTDEDGRFEFSTTRPAPYPSGTVPAHIHLTVEGAGVPRQWTDEMRFADDPLISERDQEHSRGTGSFATVRPVRREGKTQHVEFNIRAKSAKDF